MARIFISHSSRDGAQASRLVGWLRDRGFTDVFLDFDKHAGIAPGADWERKLYREVSDCEAVALILTANWFDSKWCFVEFAQARGLGKPIFPLIETPTGEMLVSPDIQHLDLVTDRDGGLDRLAAALTAITVNARGGFPWDKTRPPFPGLLAFGEDDAAIYFGRDDDIRRLIERLNARRAQGGAKLVALLGASGSGKSSLLRAGVLPRLKRDPRNWIVLPPFRPQLHPLDELASAIATALGSAGDWRRWRDLLEPGKISDLTSALAALARDLRAAHRVNEAQILLSIDQGEELFGTAAPQEAAQFFGVLDAILGDELPFIAVLALRSDYLGQLQQSGLAANFEEFSLKPMPLDRVREIIEGPARVGGLAVEEGLAAAAAKDAATDDALPLLAFALRELYDRSAATGRLGLDGYRALGDNKAGISPLENAVRQRADQILAEAAPGADELAALKEAFVPAMVRVNAEGEYARRPAVLDRLPASARPLIERLAKARLLVQRREGAAAVVEVAHEALLRKWPLLRGWLDAEREFLIGKDQLELDTAEWEKAAPDQKADALLAGLKLARARLWLVEKPRQLGDIERRFIGASIEAREAEAALRDRLRRRIQIASSAAALILAVISAAAVWQWRQADRARAQAEQSLALATKTANGLVFDLALKFQNVVGVPAATIEDILERARQLQEQLLQSGEASPDLRKSQADALLAATDTLLALGDTKGALAAATQAREIDEALVTLQPDSVDRQRDLSVSYNKVGDVQVAQGHLPDALASYQAEFAIADRLAKSDPGNAGWQQDLSVSDEKIGDVHGAQGHLPEALTSYQASFAIRDRLTKSDPGNAGWQRDLSVSDENIGDVQMVQGHLLEALASYQASLAIMDRLTKSDPGNTLWQDDLSLSDNKVGSVQVALGHFPDALASYQAGVAIMDRLAKSDPGNAGWQHDLSVSYSEVGEVQEAQGHLPDALASYQAGLAIFGRLAKSDPGNAGWQRDLSESDVKVGDVQAAQGHLADALASYQAALAVRDRLAKSDPGNAGWQRDLSVSYDGIGDVEVAEGHLPEALASYRASLAIRDRLTKSDPGNAVWQDDLSVSDERVGDVEVAQGRLADALQSYQAEFVILDRLAKSDPGNADWQRSLSISHDKVGDVQAAQDHLPEAIASYRASLAVRDRLAKSNPGNPGWQSDLAMSYEKLADVYRKSGQPASAREALASGHAILVRLVAAVPDEAQWKRNLAWFDGQIAALGR